MAEIIPIEALLEAFDYDPESGYLIRKGRRKGKRRGEIVGHIDRKGRVVVGFRWKGVHHSRFASRIIVAMVTGEWPNNEVDHRNGCKSDNRWENLRQATHSENGHNRALRAFVGTYRKGKKWCARICVSGKCIRLGVFKTREEAHQAYLETRATLVPFQPIPRRA